MKFLPLLGVVLLSCVCYSQAQEKTTQEGGPDMIFDFGMINKDAAVSRIFKLYNNTDQTARIRSIWSSPYCNVQAWSNRPIKPGKYGLMKVSYNGAEPGQFEAKLKIFYYDQESLSKDGLIENIVIRGKIRGDEQGNAGYAASISKSR